MIFEERLARLAEAHDELCARPNVAREGNGVYERYAFPVLTAEHAPLEWRYDLCKGLSVVLCGELSVRLLNRVPSRTKRLGEWAAAV